MPSSIHIVGLGDTSLETVLCNGIRETGTPSLALAVAYVSVYGVSFLRRLMLTTPLREIRLIADIRDGISHPEALRTALNEHWDVRVVNRREGTFHPKMYLAGNGFAEDGSPLGPRMCLIGSNNLTNGGLNKNIECCLAEASDADIPQAADAFRRLWVLGDALDDETLDRYEEYFAKRNRKRSPPDLEVLGVADQDLHEAAAPGRGGRRTRRQPAISTSVAAVAWAGLESSTGEYRFQIEFPRSAGEVLGRMIGGDGNVSVLCEDGRLRDMTYRFYDDNSMFRLNVPNDVPGVDRAREERSGIALVERIEHEQAGVRLQIYHDHEEIQAVVERSLALGTLGQTPTRLYGWY